MDLYRISQKFRGVRKVYNGDVIFEIRGGLGVLHWSFFGLEGTESGGDCDGNTESIFLRENKETGEDKSKEKTKRLRNHKNKLMGIVDNLFVYVGFVFFFQFKL